MIHQTIQKITDAGRLLQLICFDASLQAGWWHDPKTGQDLRAECRNQTRFGLALIAEKLCLIHSETSESMEGVRKDRMDDKLPHRKMLEVELADAVIRIADLCGALGLDLGAAIAEKLEYNQTRSDHKLENRRIDGGKAF